METSDSECFESADEEFYSDEEDVCTVISDDEKKKAVKGKKGGPPADLVRKNSDVNENVTPKVEERNEPCLEENKPKVSETSTKISEVKKEDIETNNVENVHIEDISLTTTTKDIEKVDSNKNETTTKQETDVKNEPINEIKRPKEAKIGKLGCKVKKKPDKVEPVKTDKVTVPKVDKIEEKPCLESNKPEEDLWDDDEIDWGKEQELETKPSLIENQNQKEQELETSPTDNWEDDWEPIGNVKQDKEVVNQSTSESSWGGWGNWGVSSILNTATQSVSTLTNHVSQGLSTVLESGIGVPDPEDLAKQHKQDEAELKEKMKNLNIADSPVQQNSLAGFGLGNLVSGVSHLTKFVESTGTKVISGGLDTLETIGKKTMEVLQEGDPGLKKKRAFLKLDQNKPILSQVLREAKEKADEENRELEQRHIRRKAKNYETLFDDHQGLVHLEALEMLSKQCDIKLETLTENCTGDALTEMQETMDQVKELCELPEEDEDEQLTFEEIKDKILTAVSEININISYNKLIATWTETEEWLENVKLNVVDEAELHQQGIEILAQLTAIAVEQFHKTGELLLVKEHRSTADEADSLVQLTTSLIALIGIVAAKFSDKLNSKATTADNKESVNELITNVFFEASNSSSYIQDAFQLLIPVLQVGAV